MGKKNSRNTKGRIVSAAWKLFYEQGYDHTTVDEIIELSHTSKGSFYHYFEGKDALLSSLSYLFDEKYEELASNLDPDMDSLDQLLYLNRELFSMIENSISPGSSGPALLHPAHHQRRETSFGPQPSLLPAAATDHR